MFAAICLSPSAPSIFAWSHHEAENEVYYRPRDQPPVLSPPFLPGPCSPIAPRLFAGYEPDIARDSLRRREADVAMRDLIENEIVDEVRIVRVEAQRP